MKKWPQIWIFVVLAAALLTPVTDADSVSLPDSVLPLDHLYKYTFTDFEGGGAADHGSVTEKEVGARI